MIMEGLDMAKQTGAEYREKNRIRLQRYYEKQAATGKKRISAIISDGTHGHIMAEKDRTGMSLSEILESALNQRYGSQDLTYPRDSTSDDMADDAHMTEPTDTSQEVKADRKELVSDNTGDGNQAVPALEDDLIPDCIGREITLEERDRFLVQVAEACPGKDNVQRRVNILNRNCIPVSVKSGQYGGEWTGKKFTDNLCHARKRLQKK